MGKPQVQRLGTDIGRCFGPDEVAAATTQALRLFEAPRGNARAAPGSRDRTSALPHSGTRSPVYAVTVQRPHSWLHRFCSDAPAQQQDVRSPNTGSWERVVRPVPILQPYRTGRGKCAQTLRKRGTPPPRILRTQPNGLLEPRNCLLYAPCVGKRISHGTMRLREGGIEIQRCLASGQCLFVFTPGQVDPGDSEVGKRVLVVEGHGSSRD